MFRGPVSLVMDVKWFASFSASSGIFVSGSSSLIDHCLTWSSLSFSSIEYHILPLPAALNLSDSLSKYFPFQTSSVAFIDLSILFHLEDLPSALNMAILFFIWALSPSVSHGDELDILLTFSIQNYWLGVNLEPRETWPPYRQGS